VYRSQFWVYLSTQSYLNLSIYQDELLRLYESLGMYTNNSVFYAIKSKSIVFASKFDMVQRSSFMTKLLANSYTISASTKDIETSSKHPSVNTQEINSRLISLRNKEKNERQTLYVSLKAQDKNASIKEALFVSFGITDTKKRKQKLLETIWTANCSDNHAFQSAQVVLKIISLTEQQLMDWARAKQKEKMAKDCVASVQACLISIQRLKRDRPYARVRSGTIRK